MTRTPRPAALLKIAILLACASVVSAQAQTPAAGKMLGGASGVVRTEKGAAPEGMMVQLVSAKTAVRTTVYTHADGRYEFPKLEAGSYTLRIALPREFRAFVKEGVPINGASKLADIVLQPAGENGVLPDTPEIWGQLTGEELMMSHPGHDAEKRVMNNLCAACHSLQQIFRNHYDKDSWTKIIYRMVHGAGSPLININPRGNIPPEQEAAMVSWLAEARAPGVKNPPPYLRPRETGRATEAIITEYALPRLELATHDVAGDAKGFIWYSAHRSSYIGRLDPKTGQVKEYHIPVTPGAAPGTHWLHPDDKGNIWASENWSHHMIKLDPATGAVKKVPWFALTAVNSPMGGNYAMDAQGFIWKSRDSAVIKFDAETGAIVKRYPTKKFRQTYGAAISPDGRYYGGGSTPEDGLIVLDIKTGEVFEPETSKKSEPARGSFDNNDNYWSGGRGGILVEFDTTTHMVHEYKVPTTYGGLYTAKADKNGEVWTGGLQTGRYFRFNPKNQQWTAYLLPEPYGHDRESWIDNSTTPVSVWYVDHEGYITHIQPFE